VKRVNILTSKARRNQKGEAACSNYAEFFNGMSILILIQLAATVSLFNHLWFKTDFFAFYAKFIKKLLPQNMYMYLMIEEYMSRPPQDYIHDSYISYLYAKKCFCTNFFEVFILKLLSCALCLTTWMSAIICLSLGAPLYIGVLFILIRILDSLLNFFLKIH
jgi:hypothetical protein